MMSDPSRLRRLLSPRSIAVVGGAAAGAAIRASRAIGFDGPIWAINPVRETLAGVPCLPSIADLPAVPDAVLLAVPAARCVDLVAALGRMGAGGVVCHSSGFAEDDADEPDEPNPGEGGAAADGASTRTDLQRRLVEACGEMPLIGPNCIGLINCLDSAALWPDEHGGTRVDRGVAVITQSGNVGQNLSMQRRGLPLACLVTLGNGAVVSPAEVLDALLEDDRITAIGLHLETIGDVADFARAAATALQRRVPLVVLKTGTSELGAQANRSHTSSLASPDALVDALFTRMGIGRVDDLSALVETLVLLHVHGGLPDPTLATASCSGGEAALLADGAARAGLALPTLPATTIAGLADVLGSDVTVRNPLDYHTRIWGDEDAQHRCFDAFLTSGAALHLLSLDLPRADRADPELWARTLRAFVAAATGAGSGSDSASRRRDGSAVRTAVVSLLPEGLPEDVSRDLVEAGIAPLHGVGDALTAARIAADIGAAHAAEVLPPPLPGPVRTANGQPAEVLPDTPRQLDEASAKALLAGAGLAVPRGVCATASDEASEAVHGLQFPLAAKVVSPPVAHKTELGAVRLGLSSPDAAREAISGMEHLGDLFLLEEMTVDGVVELVVGIRHDDRFGPVLTVGAGGVHVEILRDVTTLLLPTTAAAIDAALRSLRAWPLLNGARGRPRADVAAAVDAIEALCTLALTDDRLSEIEVNPLIVRAAGHGAVAVDALVRTTAPHH